ncbi:MAG: ATP-binding protein [Candidatus Wallbacteria bacterium]|nr:ATP-binding protein [Candidatus Wallbacteria bacterium]
MMDLETLGGRMTKWWQNEVAVWRGIGRQILRFLGVSSKTDVHRWNQDFPVYLESDLHRAFQAFFPAEGMTVEAKGIDGLIFPGLISRLDALLNTGRLTNFGALGRQAMSTGPDKKQDLEARAAFFVSGGRFPMVFVVECEKGFFPSLSLMGAIPRKDDAVDWAAGLMKRLESWMSENSCLRGQLLRPAFRSGDANKIDILPMANPESFQLAPHLVIELEETFIDFLARTDELEAAGVECQRGLLLCGPPGTGKTSTCRYLKNRLPGYTMITVASDALLTLKDCFDLARRFSPSILVIEDVDGIAQMREPNQANFVLTELMNQMDGLHSRDRVAVLLTSNSWEFLEKALAERPGRVDHIVVYDPPEAGHRRVLLEQFLASLNSQMPLDTLVAQTDGLTPAQLKEIVKRAAVASMRRDPENAWTRELRAEDLRRSVETVRVSPLARTRKTIGLNLRKVK